MKRALLLLALLFSTLCFAEVSELSRLIAPQESGINKVGLIHIEKDQAINQSTLLYVKLALESFKKQGVIAVVLQLDTPGGEVFSAMKISTLLRDAYLVDGLPVVTFIDNWAISAGALIAYSTPYIVVRPSSLMGAAQPVIMGSYENEVKPASEKVVSALRAEFASTAETFQRDPDIAEAMVDSDVILVWRQGKVIRLDRQDQILKKDLIISNAGKLLTLRGDEIVKYGIAQELTTEKSLLDTSFFRQLSSVKVVEYQDWKVKFYAFLMNPFVASLLMMALTFGFYIEVSSPGFGWGGIIAIVALASMILTNFTLATSGYLEWIFLGIGSLLIVIDLFFFVGFGVVGTVGILMALISLFLLFIPYIDAIDLVTFKLSYFEKEALMDRLVWLVLFFILACAIVITLAKLVSKKILPKLSIVSTKTSPSFQSSFCVSPGSEGCAFTPLRPSGKVEIEGEVYNAITQGRFIEKGAKIVVLKQEGEKLIVE